MNSARRTLLAFAIAALLTPSPARATPLVLEVLTSEITACGTDSLCVDVSATIRGTTGFGTQTLTLPLPVPDLDQWVAVSGETVSSGSMKFVADYWTTDVLAAQRLGNYGALVDSYEADFDFIDSSATVFFHPSIFQTNTCRPIPDDYTASTYLCGDANGGGGRHSFGPNDLDWATEDIHIRAAIWNFGSPKAIQGTESIGINAWFSASIVYDRRPTPAVPEPGAFASFLVGAALVSARLRRTQTRRSDGDRATPRFTRERH